MIENIKFNKKKHYTDANGEVIQIINNGDENYKGFKEAYLSSIFKNKIKGWTYHKRMIMNLMVIKGKVKFIFYDTRKLSAKYNQFTTKILSDKSYITLTVPSKVWFAFKGIETHSIILNISNTLHNDKERIKKPLDYINYKF